MTDITLTIMLGIEDCPENRSSIAVLKKWLDQGRMDRSYHAQAEKFAESILESAGVVLNGTTTLMISHSASHDWLIDLRHPRRTDKGAWVLDDLPMRNGIPIWIKMADQWIKGKVSKRETTSILLEPENIMIPVSEELFLHW